MSVNAALRRRQLGFRGRIQLNFAVDKIRLKEVMRLPNTLRDELDPLNGNPTSAPLASTRLNSDIIAVAHEDGCINLVSVKKLKSVSHWNAHDNAIFDIKTSSDNKSLITASGDSTIRVWDVELKKETVNFSPHYSTIKSISIYDANTLASGSRDGSIKIHDLRVKEKTVIIIRDAHRNTTIRRTTPKHVIKTDPISCVTNVVFDPYCPRLYSAGANDATIKLWDLRGTSDSNRPKRTREGHVLYNQPYQVVHHPSQGVHCGYSHLLFSSGRLYASCSDNKIYCYESFNSTNKPIKFTGYRYNTYLRLSIMDDRFLFSGGKAGHGALVWSLEDKHSSMYYPETTKQPIGQLKPDSIDNFDTNVIETDWDSLSVFSMRDDGLVCKWTMQHVLDSERKKLASENTLSTNNEDITIQMADIINVNVLRPNHRVSNLFSQSQMIT